jgi:hypothetical protein
LTFEVASGEGRLAQAASLIVLLVVPAAAQVHFILKFLAGTFYRENQPLWSGTEHLTHYVPASDAFSGEYFYDRLGAIAPGFAPFWEPWFFILFEIAIFAVLFRSLVPVFCFGSKSPKRPVPSSRHAPSTTR